MPVLPTAGHAAAWARLTPRTIQSGNSSRPGRTGKGDPCLRGALGQSVMAASRTDTRLGEQYRRTARRRGKQKGIAAVSRVTCEIAWLLTGDRAARFTDLGAGYYSTQNPQRRTRSRIGEIERLNPGMKVTLTPIDPAATAA
jgi:transposase